MSYLTRKELCRSDATDLENEINDFLVGNTEYDLDQIEIFAKVTDYSYYPIGFSIDSESHIRLDNHENLNDIDVFIGSNRQFLYRQYIIPENMDDQWYFEFDQYFKTAWNPDKFMIFRNGYLMNPALFQFVIPDFNNTYKYKRVYTTSPFKAGDRLDIYYIECDDNWDHVPINKDIHISYRKYFAIQNGQVVVKIPYPSYMYQKGPEMFFVFNDSGYYLDNRYEYTVSEDNLYITLKDSEKLVSAGVDYLVFVFPYMQSEREGDFTDFDGGGERSSIEFFYSYSIFNPENTDGVIEFDPPFTEYDLTYKSFLLFGNSTWISPERYEVIDNTHIKFTDPVDKAHCGWTRYTMAIFNETDRKNEELESILYEVVPVEATTDLQTEFNVPAINNKYYSFVLTLGSILLERDSHYYYNTINQTVLLLHDKVKLGRNLYFIFLAPKRLRLNKEVHWTVVNFQAKEVNPTLIPPETYERQWFQHKHILLFVNGVYIEPERYEIVENKIYMKPTLEKGYQEPMVDSWYTLLYLKDYDLKPKGNIYPELDEDMRDDSDEAQYFEAYNYPYMLSLSKPINPEHITNNNLPLLESFGKRNGYVVEKGQTIFETKDHTGYIGRPKDTNKIIEVSEDYYEDS